MCAPQDRTSDEMRAAAAGLLASICKAGGAVLWSSAGYYAEEALKAAVAALEDAASVRGQAAYARGWGRVQAGVPGTVCSQTETVGRRGVSHQRSQEEYPWGSCTNRQSAILITTVLVDNPVAAALLTHSHPHTHTHTPPVWPAASDARVLRLGPC